MGLRLAAGELSSWGWDWLLFNERGDGNFSFSLFQESAAIQHIFTSSGLMNKISLVKRVGGESHVLLYVPAIIGDGEMLGYTLGNIASHQAVVFEIGKVVSERMYVFVKDGHPHSMFSALLDNGYIIITDDATEAMCKSNDLAVVIVHPDDPSVVYRPVVLSESHLCRTCLKLVDECICYDAVSLHTSCAHGRALARKWEASGGSLNALVDPKLEMWRRYKDFMRVGSEGTVSFAKLETTPDAHQFRGKVPPVMQGTMQYEFQTQGREMDAIKLNFMMRLLSRRHPSTALAPQRPAPLIEDIGTARDFEPTAIESLDRAFQGHTLEETDASNSCPLCGAKFARVYEMRRHVKHVHQQAKDFACEFCGKRFSTQQNVKSHVAAIHEKRRDYGCELCGMEFSSKSKVTRHMRCVHLKERSHQCDGCGRLFFQQSDLARHRRRAGEKSPCGMLALMSLPS